MVERILISLLVAALLGPGAAAQESTPVEQALSQLQDGVTRGAPEVWDEACAALVAAGPEALAGLELLATSHDYRLRFLVVRTSGQLLDALMTSEAATFRDLTRARGLMLDGLADEHPSVRDLARELAAARRPIEAVPILIERLPYAQDSERKEMVHLLTELTRVPIGDAPAAWEQWWEESRADFTLPPPDETPRHQTREGPSYHGETVSSQRVVFIVDSSRSMEWGDRFGRARRELIQTIDGLAEEVRFTVIFFGGKVSVWHRDLVLATPASKQRACRWILEQHIVNATATWTALATALDVKGVDTIYLLSDGDPNVGAHVDPTAICRQVRAVNTFRRVRIFTIGFFFGEVPEQYRDQARDTSRTRAFMRRLAEENRGRFVEIDE
jgi:hypothetical protein